VTRIGVGVALCVALSFYAGGSLAGQASAEGASAEAGPTVRFFGNSRVRGAMDRNRRSAPARERIRLRLRFGVEAELRPALSVGGRLTTMPDPNVPNAPHVDLGDGFRQIRFALDRLYVRWEPTIGDERPLAVWAGKFENPLRQPVPYGELTWDADVQPEGFAAVFEPLPELRLVAGGFALLNQAGTADVNIGAVQAAVRLDPAPDWQVDAAVGGYFYSDIDATAAVALAEQNRGNAVLRDAGGEVNGFASGFDIWQAFGQLAYEGFPTRLAIGGEYFSNASAAPGTDGSGFGVSGQVGGFRGVGSYVIQYRYQDVGAEAVFTSLAQLGV